MKRHWKLAFLIAGALVISTPAQDVNAQSTNTVVTQQQGSSDKRRTHNCGQCVVKIWAGRTGSRKQCHQHLPRPA